MLLTTAAAAVVRAVVSAAVLLTGATAIHTVQLLALPLWPVHRRSFHALIDHTQVAFVELLVLLHVLVAPGELRVNVPRECAAAGRDPLVALAETVPRAVVVSNHLTLLDWTYLWLVAHRAGRGAALKIVLKSSPRFVPVFGPGMAFFRFVFLQRNWARDRPRLQRAVARLFGGHGVRWLLLFPEGTILTRNTLERCAAYCARAGVAPPPDGMLLPRSTGLRAVLAQLAAMHGDDGVQVLDTTLVYDGWPRLPSEAYSPTSVYVLGRAPKVVHVRLRPLPLAAVPLADRTAFDAWLRAAFELKADYVRAEAADHGDDAGVTVRVPIGFHGALPWRLAACAAVFAGALAAARAR